MVHLHTKKNSSPLTFAIIKRIDLVNIKVSKSISLSQDPVRIQDGSDGVLAVFGEASTAVVHDGVKVIRDLKLVNIVMAVLVKVVVFVLNDKKVS